MTTNDRAPEIVSSYANQGERLIQPAKREGRCGAHSLGILKSSYAVVLVINADVHLPKDFLQRISPHV